MITWIAISNSLDIDFYTAMFMAGRVRNISMYTIIENVFFLRRVLVTLFMKFNEALLSKYMIWHRRSKMIIFNAWLIQCFNPTYAETGIFQKKDINSFADDAFALVFHKGLFQPHEPPEYIVILENVTIYSCFLKLCRTPGGWSTMHGTSVQW